MTNSFNWTETSNPQTALVMVESDKVSEITQFKLGRSNLNSCDALLSSLSAASNINLSIVQFCRYNLITKHGAEITVLVYPSNMNPLNVCEYLTNLTPFSFKYILPPTDLTLTATKLLSEFVLQQRNKYNNRCVALMSCRVDSTLPNYPRPGEVFDSTTLAYYAPHSAVFFNVFSNKVETVPITLFVLENLLEFHNYPHGSLFVSDIIHLLNPLLPNQVDSLKQQNINSVVLRQSCGIFLSTNRLLSGHTVHYLKVDQALRAWLNQTDQLSVIDTMYNNELYLITFNDMVAHLRQEKLLPYRGGDNNYYDLQLTSQLAIIHVDVSDHVNATKDVGRSKSSTSKSQCSCHGSLTDEPNLAAKPSSPKQPFPDYKCSNNAINVDANKVAKDPSNSSANTSYVTLSGEVTLTNMLTSGPTTTITLKSPLDQLLKSLPDLMKTVVPGYEVIDYSLTAQGTKVRLRNNQTKEETWLSFNS